MKNCYEILGIEPTNEIKKIKRAYAARVKECHPEEHPEEFEKLRGAYERALAQAQRPEWIRIDTEEQLREALERGAAREEADAMAQKVVYREEFAKISEAGGERAELKIRVQQLMAAFDRLYGDEQTRNNKASWIHIFENYKNWDTFCTTEFVTQWKEFLMGHTGFNSKMWKYFDLQDGRHFNSGLYGVVKLDYKSYIKKAKEEEKAEAKIRQAEERARKKAGVTCREEVWKTIRERSWQILLLLLALAGLEILKAVLR